MTDYLNGWTVETAKMIPPIERVQGQKPAVKIREYILPIRNQNDTVENGIKNPLADQGFEVVSEVEEQR